MENKKDPKRSFFYMRLKNMKKLLVLFISIISLSCFANDKIIGGEEAYLKDFPFIVSVGDYCGGTIISKKWILTAAHCKPFDFVKAGSDNLKANSMKRYAIKKAIIHPEMYERSDGVTVNDIALLELRDEIDFNTTKLSSIKIADKSFEQMGGQQAGIVATVAGWGLTDPNGNEYQNQLLKVSVPVVTYEKANGKNSYDGAVDMETMLPAGHEEGGKDSCSGDSGGPLVVTSNETSEKTLIGVVSWGDICAAPNFYGIYAKVSNYAEWIHSTIE